MNRDFADKLITNLRSGNFHQTKGFLYDGHGYCCLGVAYETAGYKPNPVMQENGSMYWLYPDRMISFLNSEFQEEIEMKSNIGEFEIGLDIFALSTLNDEGLTFDQIADIIDYFCDVL